MIFSLLKDKDIDNKSVKVIKLLSQLTSMMLTIAFWHNGIIFSEILKTIFIYSIISIPLMSIYFFKEYNISGLRLLNVIGLVCILLDIYINLFNDLVLLILLLNSFILILIKEGGMPIGAAVFQTNLSIFCILILLSFFIASFSIQIYEPIKYLLVIFMGLALLSHIFKLNISVLIQTLKHFVNGYLFAGDMLSRNLALIFFTIMISSEDLAEARLFFQITMLFAIKAQIDTFSININVAFNNTKNYKNKVQAVTKRNTKVCLTILLSSFLISSSIYSNHIVLVIFFSLAVVLLNVAAGPINLFLRKNYKDLKIVLINIPLFIVFIFYLTEIFNIATLFTSLIILSIVRFFYLLIHFKKT